MISISVVTTKNIIKANTIKNNLISQQPDFKNNSNDVNEVSDLVDVEIPTVNEVVNQMTGGYVNTPKHTTKSEVKILNLDNGVNTGKRGRPKKNK